MRLKDLIYLCVAVLKFQIFSNFYDHVHDDDSTNSMTADDSKTLEWYTKAAAHGDEDAVEELRQFKLNHHPTFTLQTLLVAMLAAFASFAACHACHAVMFFNMPPPSPPPPAETTTTATSLSYDRAMSGLQLSAFGAPSLTPINVDVVVPLGPDCLAAWHVKRSGWRTASYPLDWTLFDDRSQHLTTISALFASNFHELVHLDSSKLKQETFVLSNGTMVQSTRHEELGIRWIHADPLSEEGRIRVVERSERLVQRLERADVVHILFIAAWRMNESPSPPARFRQQIVDLQRNIEMLHNLSKYTLLLVLEAHPHDPSFLHIQRELLSVSKAHILVVSVLPSRFEFGDDVAWDSLMKRFRTPLREMVGDHEIRDQIKEEESSVDVETCLFTHFEQSESGAGLTKVGFVTCVGESSSQNFEELDVDGNDILDLGEFSLMKVVERTS